MGDLRLEAEGLSRLFTGGAGVRGVHLGLAPGELHALVGLNGAGKTTLMRLLLGMLRPDRGRVQIGGQDLDQVGAATWAKVGHLVERPATYPELDTRANLEVAARLRRVPVPAIGAMVQRALRELRLEHYERTRARVLSAGNRQRVGLAAALQHDPDLIVLDEPTNGLDPAGVVLLRESLLRRASRGAAVLVSSHHLDEVSRIADHIAVMHAGQLIGTLDPQGVDIERSFFALVHAADERDGS